MNTSDGDHESAGFTRYKSICDYYIRTRDYISGLLAIARRIRATKEHRNRYFYLEVYDISASLDKLLKPLFLQPRLYDI